MLRLSLTSLPAVALLLAASLGAQSDPAQLAEQGKQAMAAGRFDEAAKVWGALSAQIPNNPGLLLNQGMALAMAGRDAEALGPLKQATTLADDIFPAFLFLGGSYLKLQRPAEAIAPLERALELQPDYVQARGMLAEALTDLGRARQALPHQRKLVEADSQNPAAWAGLIQSYDALAAREFEALEKSAPESPWMLRLVADTRLSQQQYPSAFFLYREALNRAPEMRGLHAAVAEIYRRTDRVEWAAGEVEKEAALGAPDCGSPNPECNFLTGKLDAVANAGGDTPEARYWRARAYGALAVGAFGKLEALPASAAKHDITGRLLAEQKRHADAAAEWKKALALAPGDPGFEAAYAMQLFLSGDVVEARPLLEKQLAAAPQDPQWNFFLGDIHLREQEPEKAAPLLEKAVAADPQLMPAHHALGRALMAMDQPKEAIPHLQAALESDQDGSLHYQLAQAFIRTGRRDEARAPLTKSQQLRQAAEARQADAQSMEITAP